MGKSLEIYPDTYNFPVRNVTGRFGDKWSVLKLPAPGDASEIRFNGLHKMIQSFVQKFISSPR